MPEKDPVQKHLDSLMPAVTPVQATTVAGLIIAALLRALNVDVSPETEATLGAIAVALILGESHLRGKRAANIAQIKGVAQSLAGVAPQAATVTAPSTSGEVFQSSGASARLVPVPPTVGPPPRPHKKKTDGEA